MNTDALRHWLAGPPTSHRFPYEQTIDAFHHYGKHAMPEDWLNLLKTARDRLPTVTGPRERLAAFLSTALDKADNRFDYRSYLALPLLPIPDPDTAGEHTDRLMVRRDRHHVLLLADLIGFELHALDGTRNPLPQLRPSAPVVRKRLRHAVRATVPALRRLSFATPLDDDPLSAARRLTAMVCVDRSSADRMTLRTTMLPVSTVHDEYLFIRTLQAFELCFAQLAVDLTAVRTAVGDNRLPAAGNRLCLAATLLRETAPMWSLLATMQPEAFHAFRENTDGASAIQSRAYKLVESLCRTPDPQRLHSVAYRSVPDVQARIRGGHASIDDTLDAIRADQHVIASTPTLADGMRQFTAALRQWRRTHHRLAVRMLGTETTGTGATPGTPYLRQNLDTTVFRRRTTTAHRATG
ncbi:tryptophan 2,3-dioxygenase family protein [Micromonospora sp. WMMD1082]|uniref:tryptophan 2,3-dioxygenase family protein n=1 Tax=Micromonospora sp. WMMD1082 TaxID=3016104 RepID=UPI002415D400|nr:tryptophan 2,3-dioxygenase family protein [Micromonospora sp. WMMD1082]MDG4794991.1 tryptophan 2,3-dioxygenase family protein [Micromonospora sp. WMMD1082]